jgi:shikimate kinase
MLQRPVIDFDAEIERRLGISVAQVFETHGEEFFRKQEADLSRELVEAPPAILSPGGGWVTRPEAVEIIRHRTRLVWLKVSPKAALRRMGARVASRPLLMKGDPRDILGELARLRERYYREADAVVDTELLTAQQVAEHVAQLASRWDAQIG